MNINSSHWGPHEGPHADVYTGKGGYQYSGKTYENSSHANFTNGCVDCHMAPDANNQGVGNHSFYPQLATCQKAGCHICSQAGWIELLGMGMIHPNVLKAGGIDPAEYTGFAWGCGIDRLVMMKYNIEDIRHFESGKLDFLRQFA